MTTKTRNNDEAAERLLGMDYRMVEWWAEDGESYSLVQAFKATDVEKRIAAERRATVQRIRAGSQALMYRAGKNEVIAVDALALILDEEAAR